MKTICATATALAVLAPMAGAEEINLTISASHAIQIPWIAPLQEVIVAKTNERLRAMGSENSIVWTESYGGALYSFGDTLEAVGDGITDAGWIGSLWEESKMPYDNLTYFTPFATDDYDLQMQVFNRLYDEVPALKAEWEDNNVVFLGATGADTYHLYTTFPVDSIDDLKGRKILAPGPTAPWMAAIGAVPVNGALPTYYNQIETGVADGVISIVTGAHPLKIQEVAPYVTLVGVGANFIGGFGVNKDIWDGLPGDVQQVLTELGPEYSARNAEILKDRYDTILTELAADPKVTLTTLPAAERQKWVDALPDLAGQWAAKLPEGKVMLDAYMAAIREAGATPARDWKVE
ncbi:C4-dicarboxylate TRAP transporter substrate-binding protein [Paracoccus sp. 11-3]|uniref:C4-dicarboxylate TRAP transporter substrate-binding protein n=1 Tax=Paracoccus amoyensis TaxID=2760093 RepID=A0A926G7U7_9RHOB|nr:C4-dicarboxylate TRAP transporter substrate-binding protein [Paracoccus amoyensis]MBC9247453.1 C4-dicarboxylate TRAP transporter substrate-binding protein [Paracoccus amoyensis]